MAFYQGKQRNFSFKANTQMNITALVDVTLVTLIIYILVSPALELGIDVKLPEAKAHRMQAEEPTVISLSKDGKLFMNNLGVTEKELRAGLETISDERPGSAIVIRADTVIQYGEIIHLLDMVRETGLVNVGLVTRARRE